MIRAKLEAADGETVLLFGLSEKNLEELRKNRPIFFDGRPLGYDGKICIMWGETEAAIEADIRTRVGPGTTVNDLRKKHD